MKTKMVKMTDDRFEAELTQRWLEGNVIGVRDAIGFLDRQAGMAFGERLDNAARALREASDLLKQKFLPDVEKTPKQHEQDHLSGKNEIEEFTE